MSLIVPFLIRNLCNVWMLFGYLLAEHHLRSCCGTFSTGSSDRQSSKNEGGRRKEEGRTRHAATNTCAIVYSIFIRLIKSTKRGSDRRLSH